MSQAPVTPLAPTMRPLSRARAWIQNPVRAIVFLGALAIISILAASEIYLMGLRKNSVEHALHEAVSISRILSEQSTRALQGVDLVLHGIADRMANLESAQLAQVDRDFLVRTLLKSRAASMPHISSIFVVDRKGRVINDSSDERGDTEINIADREYFQFHQQAGEDKVFIGPPLINRQNDTWTVHMSRQIHGPGRTFGGIVVAALNLDYFEHIDSLELNYITPISLYLNDGHLLARAPRDASLIGHPFELPPAASPGEAIRAVRQTNSPDITLFRPLDHFPLTLSVSVSENVALAEWRENAVAIRTASGTISAFILLIAFLLAREVMREQALAGHLAQTAQTLQALVDTAMDAIVTVDANDRIVLFNPAAEAMFGRSAASVLGSRLDCLLPPRYRQSHADYRSQFSTMPHRSMAITRTVFGLRANGDEFPIESNISKVTIQGKTLHTAILRDVSERQQAQQALTETNAELSRLSAALITLREEERSRIARELHDELGQLLTGIRMEISWLGGHLGRDQIKLIEKTQAIKGLIDQTIVSVRRISSDLRPLVLDDLGFSAAANWYVDQFSARTGLSIALNLAEEDPPHDEALATTLFRVLQESLTNIARHAEASAVEISLLRRNDEWIFSIRDNGCGFMQNGQRPAGFGLLGMRERVRSVGGSFSVASTPGQGTLVEAHIPINQESSNAKIPSPAGG